MKSRNLPAQLVRGLETGNWTARLTTLAQVLIGIVALLGVCAWLTLNPTLLLTFLFAQPLLLAGIVAFGVAAVFGEKGVLLETFTPGQTVCVQGRDSEFVFVVKSGEFEGMREQEEGTTSRKFAAGDFIDYDAAIGGAPYQWTVKALSPGTVYRITPADFALLGEIDPSLRQPLKGLLDKPLGELIKR